MLDRYRFSFILLGVGIGIILTNIIYSINPNIEYRDYSKEEIIEEAASLGMVFIKDTIDASKEEKEGQQVSQNVSEDASMDIHKDTKVNNLGAISKDIPPKVSEDIQVSAQIVIPEDTPADMPENLEGREEIQFTIEYGDSLIKVSNRLYKLGIIDDAQEFIRFGKEAKIDRRLRVGRYNLSTGLDYQTIAKIFTKPTK